MVLDWIFNFNYTLK